MDMTKYALVDICYSLIGRQLPIIKFSPATSSIFDIVNVLTTGNIDAGIERCVHPYLQKYNRTQSYDELCFLFLGNKFFCIFWQ